jgi:hypothetical protein
MDAVKSLLDRAKQNDQDLEEVAKMKSEDHTGLPRVLVKPMRLRLWVGLEEQELQGSKGRESTLMDGAQSDEESDNVRPKKRVLRLEDVMERRKDIRRVAEMNQDYH